MGKKEVHGLSEGSTLLTKKGKENSKKSVKISNFAANIQTENCMNITRHITVVVTCLKTTKISTVRIHIQNMYM
jgi:hypothetical protein